MTTIGLLLLIGLWANADNVIEILKEGYEEAKYVILFIGIARLFDMLMSINGAILNNSHHYWFNTVAIVLLAGLAILTNMLLIPEYGIEGAAIATSISLFSFNLLKFLYLWIRERMQPLTLKTGLLLIIGVAVYFISTLLPQLDNIYLDILVRSSLILALYIPAIVLFKISSDISNMISKALRLVGIKTNF